MSKVIQTEEEMWAAIEALERNDAEGAVALFIAAIRGRVLRPDVAEVLYMLHDDGKRYAAMVEERLTAEPDLRQIMEDLISNRR